jgi:hypothetical protein
MQTTKKRKNVIRSILLQNQKSTFFRKKLIGPFSKLDIFKMSIFRKPLPLYFWTFLLFYRDTDI